MRQRGALLTGGHSPAPSNRPLLIALGSREAAVSKGLLGLPSSCQLAVLGPRQSPQFAEGLLSLPSLWGLLTYPAPFQPSSCRPGFSSLQGEGRAGEPPRTDKASSYAQPQAASAPPSPVSEEHTLRAP